MVAKNVNSKIVSEGHMLLMLVYSHLLQLFSALALMLQRLRHRQYIARETSRSWVGGLLHLQGFRVYTAKRDLSCKREAGKIRLYMHRRVTTSPCKQALKARTNEFNIRSILLNSDVKKDYALPSLHPPLQHC